MSFKFFKAADFPIDRKNPDCFCPDHLAERANAKLEREGKIVKGSSINGSCWLEDNYRTYLQIHRTFLINTEPTHRALLINIEPIKKCTHPKEKVVGHFDCSSGVEVWKGFRCECGVKMQPKEFEEVND